MLAVILVSFLFFFFFFFICDFVKFGTVAIILAYLQNAPERLCRSFSTSLMFENKKESAIIF